MNRIETYLDKVVRQATASSRYVAQAGQFVQSAAILLCPADSGYLRNNIFLDVNSNEEGHTATVYTNVQYAPYVEFGTGPKGAANHQGISPNVTPAYTLAPWWIHESQIDPGVAEKYHWTYIDTDNGRFYRCDGQPAQPFMYPALHDNVKTVLEILDKGIKNAVGGIK